MSSGIPHVHTCLECGEPEECRLDCNAMEDGESVCGKCAVKRFDALRPLRSLVNTLVINLFGGPGTGKSTTMAGLFCELKNRGVNCEMAPEYAKDKVWERSTHTLDNQLYIFGKQHHRIWRLLGQVDVVITDSPLLLSLYYGNRESETFQRLVVEEHEKLNTWNVFLTREKPFNPAGRLQNEKEAQQIDRDLTDILHTRQIHFDVYPANPDAIIQLADRAGAKIALTV